MKKRALSIAMALTLSLGLSVPAMAAEEGPLPEEEALAKITLENNLSVNTRMEGLELSMRVEGFDMDGNEVDTRDTLTGYWAILDDTTFTVTHSGAEDDGSYMVIYLSYFLDEGDGVYTRYDAPHRSYLTREGGFVEDFMDPSE